MRRLLMISPHFPPDSSAATHRVRLLAPHLPHFGWEPVVLTVAPDAYEGRLDPNLADLVPPSVEVVRVAARPARLTRRVGIGDLGLRAYGALRSAAIALCSARRFDAAFVTIYPTYPAMLGPQLKQRFGVKFILDYQDPWVGAWGAAVGGGPGRSVDFKSRLSRRVAEYLEPRALCAADGVTAVSARTYEEAIDRIGCRPPVTAEIPIGWDERDIVASRVRGRVQPRFEQGMVHLCYVGTLLPLGVDVLRALLKAVKVVTERNPRVAGALRLHFIGTSNQSDASEPIVLPHAQALGVAHLVDERPARVDYLDALGLLRQSSIVLLLGSSEPHYTPSKVFPALLASRPLLAMYHERSPVVELLRTALPPPAGQVVAFGDAERWDDASVARIADRLSTLLGLAGQTVDVNAGALEPWSARALAGRLARVCDGVA